MKTGITGGIGCGKSTAGRLFEQLGWLRIDSDQLVRTLLDNDPQIHRALEAHFGAEALTTATLPAPTPAAETHDAQCQPAKRTGKAPLAAGAQRQANRPFLAQRIFASKTDKTFLEELLHPRVRELWQTQMLAAGERPVVVEIPLLFEKNLEKSFDFTVCVETRPDLQLARLHERGMSKEDAQARIASQMPLAQKIARADKILSNHGNKAFLHAQVIHLCRTLPEMPAHRS